MRSQFVILEPGGTEWERAWAELREREGTADADAGTGEMWQYMGTYNELGMGFVHEFRHRCHPRTQQRRYYRVFAALEFNGAMARSNYALAGVLGKART